jgi:hypothetical protein
MVLPVLAMLTSATVDYDWRLTFEKTDYRATGRYEESLTFCRQLMQQPHVDVYEVGKSPEGRDMIVVVVSTDSNVLDPKKRKKPLLYINNGIHSGEIEGKDATMVLARRLVNPDGAPDEPNWSKLLDRVSLAFTPVFSVDAHERFSRFNRVNQNGPEEMGWRATAQNLNLNRDWMKVDGLETRHLLSFTNSVEPDFYIDNHTTDGGDWQYVVQWDVPRYPTMSGSSQAVSQKYIADVLPRVEEAGYLTAPYFGGFDERNPERGISLSYFSPRFSTGYWSMRNRPSLLVETHVLKPYKDRLLATLEINYRTLEWMAENSAALMSANKVADGAHVREGDDLVLTARNSGRTRPFTFKGLKFDPYKSEVSGGEIPRWTRDKVEHATVIRDIFEPGLVVKAPAGWFVPRSLVEVVDRLKWHQIDLIPVRNEVVGKATRLRAQKLTEVRFGGSTFEGRSMPQFRIVEVDREVVIPEGYVVRVDQRLGRLAAQLLEPEAPDSFLSWGFLNAFLESKEYAESYAMEPIAAKMLADDAALRAEFEEKLKDPAFAGNPGARLDWFYERSPYFDSRYRIHPIYRLDGVTLSEMVKK